MQLRTTCMAVVACAPTVAIAVPPRASSKDALRDEQGVPYVAGVAALIASVATNLPAADLAPCCSTLRAVKRSVGSDGTVGGSVWVD